ncbi:MAG: hypothetical protein SGPRY_008513, partial [Prymnesium sp.]
APKKNSAQRQTADENGKWRSKWPRERKPLVADLMRILAVLNHAAFSLNEPRFIFGDDIKDYFNQLAMATSELWKLGILFLRHPSDNLERDEPLSFGHHALLISELRLVFGTHGASNLAQRFSDAIMHQFREVMDAAEARETPTSASRAWVERRLNVDSDPPEPCHHTRRWAETSAGGVEVCPQARLYGALMYTDDPIFVVVGADRGVRALRAWRRIYS